MKKGIKMWYLGSDHVEEILSSLSGAECWERIFAQYYEVVPWSNQQPVVQLFTLSCFLFFPTLFLLILNIRSSMSSIKTLLTCFVAFYDWALHVRAIFKSCQWMNDVLSIVSQRWFKSSFHLTLKTFSKPILLDTSYLTDPFCWVLS